MENVVFDYEGNFVIVKNFGVVVLYVFVKFLDGFFLCVDYVGKVILKFFGDGKFLKVVNMVLMKFLLICMIWEGQYLVCLEDILSNGYVKISQS